jgi:hypothetical protein
MPHTLVQDLFADGHVQVQNAHARTVPPLPQPHVTEVAASLQLRLAT